MKNLLFFDTETTSKEDNAEIVQLAVVGEVGENNQTTVKLIDSIYSTRELVCVEAMAVHHITPGMQAGKDLFVDSRDFDFLAKVLQQNNSIFVAHNAQFDVGKLANYGIKIPENCVIDTLKVAMAIDEKEEMAQYNMQYLRYFFKIYDKAQAHDAMGDVVILRKLFYALLNRMIGHNTEVDAAERAIGVMIRISQEPKVIRTMPFGKYKGRKLKKIPYDYVRWLCTQSDIDKDLLYSLKNCRK